MPIDFLLDVPSSDPELLIRADAMINGATDADVVFVDVNFPTRTVARSFQVADSLTNRLLMQRPVLESSCQIVVSVGELPSRVDLIHDLLLEPLLSGRIAIIDERGAYLGDRDLARAFTTALRKYPIPISRLDQSLLRHRGVYRSQSRGRDHNYLFYYEALPEASSQFLNRLVETLTVVSPDVVVFDASTSGAWFGSMVNAACVKLQVDHDAALTPVDVDQWDAHLRGELSEPQRSRFEAAATVLAGAEAKIAILVPAYATGRSLTSAIEAIGEPDLTRCTALAVFADTETPTEPSALSGMTGVSRRRYGREELVVHWMHQVELRTVDEEHWLYQAAETLGEVRELPVDRIDLAKLGTVAMWSLYDDYGVAVERLPAGGRPPKRFFPNLAGLDEWDAHWLAEAAVINITNRLPRSNRSAMLIVIPAEQNGTQPISQALLHKCRTAVLPIPRAMIEGHEPVTPEIRERLRRHTADTIAVLDESTVTHGTLTKLVRLVHSNIHSRPDLAGAVIDMSAESPKLGIPFFSLASWAAVAEEGP